MVRIFDCFHSERVLTDAISPYRTEVASVDTCSQLKQTKIWLTFQSKDDWSFDGFDSARMLDDAKSPYFTDVASAITCSQSNQIKIWQIFVCFDRERVLKVAFTTQ